ncbi:autotransporter outer membrane beta-barrel domain-containing protein [Phaeovulum sp. W22_SRMD_FR3]|uniref:autotransporter outer membrane beta-barrel domain-containing protein n=1 Tax=Phaeovulum sp. W22_SRMD_FR3 TaxID=3240274 RepID=UPI003F966E4A
MKRGMICAAGIWALATPLAAQEGPPPMDQLPLMVQGQMTLGQAGLLDEYYSDNAIATSNFRITRARTELAGLAAPGTPTSGYKNDGTALILPLHLQYALPQQNAFLKFSLTGVFENDKANIVENDEKVQNLTVQYARFLNANTMLSFGMFYEQAQVDMVSSDGAIDYSTYGLRADLLHKFSDHWGFAGRAQYSWGQSDRRVPLPPPPLGPGVDLTQSQGDDRFYISAVFKGQYRTADWSVIPEQWVLRPVLGANFAHNTLEATADNFGAVSSGVVGDTENYGTVWATATLEKEAGMGQWAPSVTLGIEHEYQNDLSALTTSRNFAIIGLGLSQQISPNTRFTARYTRHQAFDSSRSNADLVVSLATTF